MKRNRLLLLAGTFLLLGGAGGFYLWHNRVVNNLTDAEIRQKFDCDRFDLDSRTTDYYCLHPDAYRKGRPAPNLPN